jgi:isochorismate synthase
MTPRRGPSLVHPAGALEASVDLDAVRARLERAAEAAARRASKARTPRLASVTVAAQALDPVDVLRAACAAASPATLWARPDDGFGLVGFGEAWSFEARGPTRIEDAGKAWLALVREAVCDMPGDVATNVATNVVTNVATNVAASVATEMAARAAGPAGQVWGAGPIAVGGFSFDQSPPSTVWLGFAPASLVVPRVAVLTTPHGSLVTVSVIIQPADDASAGVEDALAALSRLARPRARDAAPEPSAAQRMPPAVEELRPAAEWRAIVAEAAAAARRGALRKVVVARGVRVRTGAVDPAQVLARLRAEYPSCTLFAISRSDPDGEPRWFVGATPERLVRARGGVITAMALAGSAPRGSREDEDRRLGETLLASAKDRVEHRIVVDVIREALAATCDAVAIDEAPVLLKLSNVQHLHTPIAARMRDGVSVLDLVARLHPTPAVGGVPRDDAIAWLRRHERLDRGWYAGPIGWIDRHGEGEFAVAIRSALLGRGEALLFAGCGIVSDSVPAFEYAESRLKLRPMLSALGAQSGGHPGRPG